MTAWRERAACAGMDTEIFFANEDRRRSVALGRAACMRCPVAAECHAEAAARSDTFGVWGGRNWTGGRPERLRTDGPDVTRVPHPPQVRAEAVALYRRLRTRYPSEKAALEAVARQLDLPSPHVVYEWVAAEIPRAERGVRARTAPTDPERADAVAMLARIRDEHESLTAASKVVAAAYGVHHASVRLWRRQAEAEHAKQIGAAA